MTQPAPSGPAGSARADQYAWIASIAEPFLGLVTKRLALTERVRIGAPHILRDPTSQERIGAVDVFDGERIQAAVLTTADSPLVRIWQLVVFAPPGGALPHLSFEASANPGGCWLSVDLIPRVPLTAEPDWTRAVYEPLSELVWDVQSRADLRQSLIRPRHRLRLSPWLLSVQLESADAAEAAGAAATAYANRFVELLEGGLPAGLLPGWSAERLAERDRAERALLYSWDATDNYRFLDAIAGVGTAEFVQRTLREPT